MIEMKSDKIVTSQIYKFFTDILFQIPSMIYDIYSDIDETENIFLKMNLLITSLLDGGF